MNTNPWLLAAMLPAAAIIMLQLAIGPFGQPALLHWHQRWLVLTSFVRIPIIFLAALTLLLGSLHLLGLLPL